MARTPTLERPVGLKVLGIGFLAMLLFFIWLTAAFFNKSFVDSVDVTLETTKTGSQLPKDADVKLRGMIVGEVREVEVVDDGVRMTLAMKPELIDDVPAGVEALIVPKTLFGEKYVSLIPPENRGSESLQAGDVIAKAEVPIELEEVLNNLYPLLEAVEPAELSQTLTAVSTALSGRGEQLGDTLVSFNDYLTQINPDIPLLVDDLVALGEVSDVYAAALPDLARVLENSVTTGNTIVEKQAQLTAFLANTATLADTLTTFFSTSGEDLVALNASSRRPLYTTARYSPTFPCFLDAMSGMVPRLTSLMRDSTLHIDLRIIPPAPADQLGGMPDVYNDETERAIVSYDELNADPSLVAIPDNQCEMLERLAALPDGELPNGFYPEAPSGVDYIWPGPERAGELYELVGVDSPHGKFFSADGYPAGGLERAPVGSADRLALDRLIAASMGKDPATMSDLGILLIAPVYDGSEVAVSEAR